MATDAGRYFVEHDAYPEGHWSPHAIPATTKAEPRTTSASGGSPTTPATSESRARSSPGIELAEQTRSTGRATAAQLLADLLAGGGTIAIDHADYHHYVRVARTLRAAKNLLPADKTVSVNRRNHDWRVDLQDIVEPTSLKPIPVARRLSTRPHQTVRVLRDARAFDHLSKNLRPRVLRCIDALAKEGERRGYQAGAHHGGLRITMRGHSEVVEFKEPNNRTEHVPSDKELADQAKWSWRTYPRWDYSPSGRLKVLVAGAK